MGICQSANMNKVNPEEKEKDAPQVNVPSGNQLNRELKPDNNITIEICQEPKINNQKCINGSTFNIKPTIEFLQKAEKAICQIIMPNGGFGSGFFCKIPYTENNNILLPVLITCNHVLNKDSINSKDLTIILNGEKKLFH